MLSRTVSEASHHRCPLSCCGRPMFSGCWRPAWPRVLGQFQRGPKVRQALARLDLAGVHLQAVPHHPEAHGGLRFRRSAEQPSARGTLRATEPPPQPRTRNVPMAAMATATTSRKPRHEPWPNTSLTTQPLPHSSSSCALQCSGKKIRFESEEEGTSANWCLQWQRCPRGLCGGSARHFCNGPVAN